MVVLAASTALGDPSDAPGWITWVWCTALCGINLIFLIIGPRLWNALITAAIAIDDLGMSDDDSRHAAAWIRRHYISRVLQAGLMLVGALTGAALLRFIDSAGGDTFTLGPGEYATMFITAGLATNALWILWWIAGLIPVLRRRRSLRLDWNNPARTPAVVFLNRALWKVGAAISLGMVLLAVAVVGQPSPFTSWASTPAPWIAAVAVEFAAFAIVAAIFVRDAIWAQWQVFSLVRDHIDRSWQPVQNQLRHLALIYPKPRRYDATVLYYAELDRHFDALRVVDLKLGWALTWATSIFGAGVSLIATALTVTPN